MNISFTINFFLFKEKNNRISCNQFLYDDLFTAATLFSSV
jgi:hypothetical protein